MKFSLNLFIFFILLLSILNAAGERNQQKIKYQFKAITTNKINQQVLLTVFADKEILLENKQDNFFYEIESQDKFIFLPKGKYFIQLSKGLQNFKKKQLVFGDEKIIPIDIDKIATKKLKNITTIKAGKFFKKDANKMSLIAKEVKLIPGSGNDILSSVVSVPGVTGSSKGGEIYIRGNGKSDIYYSINNIRISNPFHNIFYSAIPNSAIHSLNVYLGGFKSDFANVQGGVIQVKTKSIKNYIPNKMDIEVDLNFVYTSANFNIPIAPNMRINIGGKRSYYSIWLSMLNSLGVYKSLGFHNIDSKPFFEDYNLFFDWRINDDLYLRFFTLFSNDDNDISYEVKRTNRNQEEIIDTSKFRDTRNWNTEALELIYKKDKLENNLSIYHYGDTNFYSQNDDIYNRYQRDFFVIKNHSSFIILKNDDLIFNLKFGSGLTYELASFISKQHPDGKQIPVASDYGVFFDGNGRPVTDNENFQKYTNDFFKYQNELVSKTTKPSRLISESYSFFDITFLKKIDFSIGGNLNYNNYSEEIDIDWRSQIVYRLDKSWLFFLKGGKYSQLPELFININKTTEAQAKYLKTPFSYHINFGFDFNFSIFTFNLEGYYKSLHFQEINNPTYDTAFPEDENENPKTLNFQNGSSYGLDFFVKQSFTKSSFGWISYSWNKSDRKVFIDNFRETPTTFGINNGNEYKNLTTKILPFNKNIEHVFKILYSFELIKDWQFGFNGSVLSGQAYDKYVIDELTLDNGSNIFILKKSGKYGRFPWRFTLHSRIDWTFLKNDSISLALYLDVQHIHTLLLKNVTGFSYDLETINKEKKTTYKDLKKGDPFPEDAIFQINSIERILGILGVLFKF